MDAAEHLPRFVDQPGRALAEIPEGGAIGAVDRWQSEHL